VKRYSSGMRVRLAFAVAAHVEPEVLIIDEVLSVGDAAFQAKCLDRMRAFANEDGRTVLYVSHNLVTVENLCPRSLLLVDGRLEFDGKTEETITRYMSALPHAEQGSVAGEFDLASADRTDSGYDRILRRLELRPGGGPVSDLVRMGSSLQLVIEVDGLDAHPDAIVILTLGSETVQQITRMTTRMMPLRAASQRRAQEQIVVDLPEVPLTPGRYHFDVRISVDPRVGPGVLDQVMHAAEFSVEAADVLGHGHRFGQYDGPVMIPWDWEIRPVRSDPPVVSGAGARPAE
jgi:lipopolysaccharide transport system ATP-binding protein